jgi:hypothetical protein
MPEVRGKCKEYLTDGDSQIPRQTRFNQKNSKKTSLSYQTVPDEILFDNNESHTNCIKLKKIYWDIDVH